MILHHRMLMMTIDPACTGTARTLGAMPIYDALVWQHPSSPSVSAQNPCRHSAHLRLLARRCAIVRLRLVHGTERAIHVVAVNLATNVSTRVGGFQRAASIPSAAWRKQRECTRTRGTG